MKYKCTMMEDYNMYAIAVVNRDIWPLNVILFSPIKFQENVGCWFGVS